MDYVQGQNLSQLVGTEPLPPAKAARYVKLITEAIHYAHQQGILHRDLKPSNVLVDASDQPRITDFGLAKRLDGDASITLTGQMLGSPNFMPPEQASSQRGKVGRHSDVYGLGAILYHLLTARPPFQAESFESVIHQLLHTEPVSPRLLNSSVPPDLETICIKCLQKEPSRRYQSAQELADELDRCLRHEPIHARPITRAERTRRWCRRNPALAGLAASLVAVFALGFTGTLWQWRQAMAVAAGYAEREIGSRTTSAHRRDSLRRRYARSRNRLSRWRSGRRQRKS
jgi:serine/threonine protein kinase